MGERMGGVGRYGGGWGEVGWEKGWVIKASVGGVGMVAVDRVGHEWNMLIGL